MMKYFFALLLFLICLPTKTAGETKPQVRVSPSVYTQIIKNHPKINREYAMELSYVIEKISNAYNVQSRKLAAILAQESMYDLAPRNCRRYCSDYGISQIHFKTVKAYGFDKDRLVTDLEYSIQAGAIVLSDMKRMYGKKEKDYWTRYNASNPVKRAIYKKLVMRYM